MVTAMSAQCAARRRRSYTLWPWNIIMVPTSLMAGSTYSGGSVQMAGLNTLYAPRGS